jgi:hemerythrin-like domain-containing protein
MKEEDILFDYADREAEVIQVMLQDHDRARSLVRASAEAIEARDCAALCSHLLAYRELLTEHITKEDDILYPYIDSQLTTSQVGEVFRRFEEVEGGPDAEVSGRYQRFIMNLEDQFQPKEEDQCQTRSTDVRALA